MDRILFDLRYAARRLRHSPGFTLVVILTLALGIGANSAIFSVVNTVLVRPLPYADPERLVTIFHWYPSLKLEAPVSAPGFQTYRDRIRAFDGVAVSSPWNVNLTGTGEPERLRGVRVSAQFFATLGVAASRGRVLLPEEDQAGRNHEIVLSDGLWKRVFGGEENILDRRVSLNGESYQVVGVMPPAFFDPWLRDAELWTPIALDPALFVPNNYTNEFLTLTARLRPGVSQEQGTRDIKAFGDQLRKEFPSSFPPDWGLRLKTLSEVRTGAIR